MNINIDRLEVALNDARAILARQELPLAIAKRWENALEKARRQLIENPHICWLDDALLILSPPSVRRGETEGKFYLATFDDCRREEQPDLSCPAFAEGFPCWHRAAVKLLKIYQGEHHREISGRAARIKRNSQPPNRATAFA